MAKKERRWSPQDGEVVHEDPTGEANPPAGDPEEPQPEPGSEPTDPQPETPAEPGEPETDDPERPETPEPGPLSKLQGSLQQLLDYDQITEVRLALYSREVELEKHVKKGSDLGVREEDARRRLRIVRGADTRFGLVQIFAPVEATEQRDVFFDREKPNGRPDAEESEDETITFRTVDGRDVTVHRDKLWERAPDLAALYEAGQLSEQLQKEIKDQDFWEEVAGIAEFHGQEDEAAKQIAELSGVSA